MPLRRDRIASVYASSPGHGIPLGPFLLHRVIGRGGMGEVWEGRHAEQQIPVAIKVLTAIGTNDPVFRSCFQNEVAAAATLDHSVIVQVFDQGTITELVEEETDGSLVAGSPYLAMELASGGTLRQARGRLEWAQIWRVLLRLLEGLAHAHARGVVHRDLKPSNVLLSQKTGGLKLTDFGLAAATEEDDALSGQVLGTPDYMAPEQIQANYRDVGPWTDLYALGCMASALSTGKPPFHGRSIGETMEAHLSEVTKEFHHVCEVPDGFNDWLRQMLEKSHHLRFQRAADAAWALKKLVGEDNPNPRVTFLPEQLQSDGRTNSAPLGARTPRVETANFTQTNVLEAGFRPGDRGSQEVAPLPQVAEELLIARRSTVPPVPEEHAAARNQSRRPPLLGTGLGIFGLRFLPIIGRVDEQKHLWTAFRESVDQGIARAVHLTGGVGTGKTRLAAWLGGRAHEAGAATLLTASFNESEANPFAKMLNRVLRCEGLSREDCYSRVARHMKIHGWDSESDARALTELLGPFPNEKEETHWVQFESDSERHTLLLRFLQVLCRVRPIVLLLDDVAQNSSALDFVRHVLNEQIESPSPVFMILTSSPSTTPEEYSELLDELHALERLDMLEVEPLPDAAHAQLIRGMLGLEDSLAELVERRTGGNPQFAIQLVGEWVEQNQLTAGDHGFRFRDGIKPHIPADMSAVWETRLERAIGDIEDVRPLEMAAILGIEGTHEDWQDACDLLGMPKDLALLNRLAEHRLLTNDLRHHTWRFAHSLVVEILLLQAKEKGHLEELHSAAADMLLTRSPIPHIRLGRHCFAAQRNREASEHLLIGAQQSKRAHRNERTWALLAKQARCLERMGISPTQPQWAENWLLKGHVRHDQARITAAKKFYNKAIEVADDSDHGRRCAASALRLLGHIARNEANTERSLRLFLRGLSLAPQDSVVQMHLMGSIGHLKASQGDFEAAFSYFDKAISGTKRIDDDALYVAIQLHRTAILQLVGRFSEAKDDLLDIRSICLKTGRRFRVAHCANDLGEIARFDGEIDAAEAYYKESLDFYESIGATKSAWIPKINLGILLAEQGRSLEAREYLEQVLIRLTRINHFQLLGGLHIVLTLVAAHESNWNDWDKNFQMGSEILEEAGIIDTDAARAARLSGEACFARGQPERALKALNLSLSNYQRMEREEDAAIVLDIIGEVEALLHTT